LVWSHWNPSRWLRYVWVFCCALSFHPLTHVYAPKLWAQNCTQLPFSFLYRHSWQLADLPSAIILRKKQVYGAAQASAKPVRFSRIHLAMLSLPFDTSRKGPIFTRRKAFLVATIVETFPAKYLGLSVTMTWLQFCSTCLDVKPKKLMRRTLRFLALRKGHGTSIWKSFHPKPSRSFWRVSAVKVPGLKRYQCAKCSFWIQMRKWSEPLKDTRESQVAKPCLWGPMA
jgi:hypothetical protein